MKASESELPEPPDLPSFTIEEDAPPPTETEWADERHEGTGLLRHPVSLDENLIDPDAAKVVRRLERSGHQAYLVGGCVRDLLLGRRPKDFDVATSARPEAVKALFRNCRIIGRRFRLAHILFAGGKVIEVATFRRNPVEDVLDEDEDDLLIRSDNVFGNAHEDALRRDFTMNALFYDIDRKQVLDWCSGLADVESRTIQTIGEPSVRFREDPIRILRAIKFAARLDLGIEPPVYDAMVSCREDLDKAARPRLFEELLRLLRQGASHRSMWLLWEIGAMAVVLPEIAAFLDDDEATNGGSERFFRMLDEVDSLTKERGAPLSDMVLWAALMNEPLAEALASERDKLRAAADFLDPLIERISVPRRIADGVRRLAAIVPRIAQGKIGRFARTEFMAPALDVLELQMRALGRNTDAIEELRRQYVRPVRASSGRPPARRSQRPPAPRGATGR